MLCIRVICGRILNDKIPYPLRASCWPRVIAEVRSLCELCSQFNNAVYCLLFVNANRSIGFWGYGNYGFVIGSSVFYNENGERLKSILI